MQLRSQLSVVVFPLPMNHSYALHISDLYSLMTHVNLDPSLGLSQLLIPNVSASSLFTKPTGEPKHHARGNPMPHLAIKLRKSSSVPGITLMNMRSVSQRGSECTAPSSPPILKNATSLEAGVSCSTSCRECASDCRTESAYEEQPTQRIDVQVWLLTFSFSLFLVSPSTFRAISLRFVNRVLGPRSVVQSFHSFCSLV